MNTPGSRINSTDLWPDGELVQSFAASAIVAANVRSRPLPPSTVQADASMFTNCSVRAQTENHDSRVVAGQASIGLKRYCRPLVPRPYRCPENRKMGATRYRNANTSCRSPAAFDHPGVSAGDGDVLAIAYHDHASVVFGVARRVTFDVRLAEEVTQEVFLSYWRTPGGFDVTKGSLRTFLCTLAHRRAVDLVRSEEGRRCRERRTAEGTALVLGSCNRDPADVSVELDLRDRARRALSSLAQGEREVIELAYFGGHSYREVAVILGLPEGTTKARIRSALKNLSLVLRSGA